MKQYLLIVFAIVSANYLNGQTTMKYKSLSSKERYVIIEKGTETPFSGKYVNHKEDGTYTCKQCGAALYKSEDKFDSQCGWPSFDDEIPGAIKRQTDADGKRTEILCNNCGGHLGHVFEGEGFTQKNTRHCVNSISLEFTPAPQSPIYDTIYFAGGCFWGVEYYYQNMEGVVATSVGYIGGHTEDPSYQDVSSGRTGHAEVVEVVYNPYMVSLEKLMRLFFEIHDFTQIDRQGPDIGEQYRSEIFYTKPYQKEIADKLINILINKDYMVATEISLAGNYYKAEEYHQKYYQNKSQQPYCHFKREIF